MAITASEARDHLFPLIKQVNEDQAPVEIVSEHGNAILMSLADYEAMKETVHLLQSSANAADLLESLAEAYSGEVVPDSDVRP